MAILVLAACASSSPGPVGPGGPAPAADAPAKARQGVRIHIEPSDAIVFVDGQQKDLAAGTGFVELEPGLHEVMVQRDGYKTWRAEVTVGEKVELLDLKLEKTTDQ